MIGNWCGTIGWCWQILLYPLVKTSLTVSSTRGSCSILLYKLAKESANYNKAHLRGDMLVVDDVEYSLRNETLPDFPDDLHPRQFSTKSNGE